MYCAWLPPEWSCSCSVHDLNLSCTLSLHNLFLNGAVPVLSMNASWMDLYLNCAWQTMNGSAPAHNLHLTGAVPVHRTTSTRLELSVHDFHLTGTITVPRMTSIWSMWYLFFAWPVPDRSCVPVLRMTSTWLNLYLFYAWPLTDWSCTSSTHDL